MQIPRSVIVDTSFAGKPAKIRQNRNTEKKNISRVAFFAHTARLHSILLGTKLYVQEASNEEQVLKENVNPEKEQR